MRISDAFRPDQLCARVYDIDLETLWAQGYRCLLFDLDNTLVAWNDCAVTPELCSWFDRVKALGFRAAVLSNNHAPRILPVAQALDVAFLADARKPGKAAAQKGMALLDATPHNCALIGDQLITDVWTGKQAGLYTILVSPISSVEYGGTKINRILERVLLRSMGLKRPQQP